MEPIPRELAEECAQYPIPKEVFEHVFSSSPALRQQGIEMLAEQNSAAGVLYALSKLIEDKAPTIISGAEELFLTLMKEGKSHNWVLVEGILTAMADHLGHTSEKVRILTEETFGECCSLVPAQACARVLVAPSKREKPPKVTVGRLHLLQRLLHSAKMTSHQEIIRFGVKYADDKNNQVRAAAIDMLGQLSKKVGMASLKGHLSKLRAPILKQIQDKAASSMPVEQEQEIQQGNQFIQMPADVCQFCQESNAKFANEDYMNMHHFHACPMLTVCKECGQAVEISGLTAHTLSQCKNSKYFKRCPRCKEAVGQKQYKQHVESKECLPAKPPAVHARCPLCHLDIPPGNKGWKIHLVQEGCENNPRK